MKGGYILNSLRLLNLAKNSLENDKNWEIPILLSALSIEAFFNEIPVLVRVDNRPTYFDFLAEAEDERTSLLFKIRIFYFSLFAKQIDKGSQPYQDIQLLVDLRNLLVHSKPDIILVPDENEEPLQKPSIVRAFVSRGIIPNPKNPTKAWQQYLLVKKVAQWSTQTASATMKWVPSLLPKDSLRTIIETITNHA